MPNTLSRILTSLLLVVAVAALGMARWLPSDYGTDKEARPIHSKGAKISSCTDLKPNARRGPGKETAPSPVVSQDPIKETASLTAKGAVEERTARTPSYFALQAPCGRSPPALA